MEKKYTTQMDAARKGILTPEMVAVAKKEYMDTDKLMKLIAEGKVIIPANKVQTCLDPNGIGNALTTKINVNLGTSRDSEDWEVEYKMVEMAVEYGAEAIMDLSSCGDTRSFRRYITSKCPAMLGTVPIYDAVVYYNKELE